MPKGVYPHRRLTEEERRRMSELAKKLGYGKWMIGKKMAPETIEKRKEANHRRREKYGYYHTPEGLERMSEAALRRPPHEKLPDELRCCPNCQQTFACRPSSRRHYCSRSCASRGRILDRSANWKGGESLARQTERHIAMSRWQYREWRREVLMRAQSTCQSCGVKTEALHAHHILSWREHPELRLDLSNGIALCGHCHRKIHR